MKQTKKTFSFPKYLIVLLGGIMLSAVVVFADTTITTNVNNAVQYIQKLVLTDNGGADGITGVIIDGNDSFKLQIYGDTYISGGVLGQDFVGDTIQGITGKFLSYCNYSGSLCKTLEELFTNDNYYTKTDIDNKGYITGSALDGYITGYTDLWSTGTVGKIYYNSGYVGIGTNNPTTKLEVYGGEVEVKIGESSTLISLNTIDNYTKIIGSGVVNWIFGVDESIQGEDSLNMFTKSLNGIRFGVNSQEKMVINTSGHVGIGTPTPAYTLDVNGTGNFSFLQSNGGIKIGATGSTGCTSNEAGTMKYMNITEGSALRMCMRTKYVIGIGAAYDRVDIVVATGGTIQGTYIGDGSMEQVP